jgi:hypothetical protein
MVDTLHVTLIREAMLRSNEGVFGVAKFFGVIGIVIGAATVLEVMYGRDIT